MSGNVFGAKKSIPMRKERKLRRLDFDLIQAEMSVIDGELLRSIVGGYKNDCFWRCIAYLDSGGCSYSESDAAKYADSYYILYRCRNNNGQNRRIH